MSTGNANRSSVEEIRVYAPSRGNLALKAETLPRTRVAEPLPDRPSRPRLRPVKPRQKRRTAIGLLRDYKVIPKTAAVAAVLVVAFAMIFMISGFSGISAAQKQINKLEKQISELESAVEKTNVDLLFSIDAESAHEAARNAGMSYPTSANFGR